MKINQKVIDITKPRTGRVSSVTDKGFSVSWYTIRKEEFVDYDSDIYTVNTKGIIEIERPELKVINE